MSDAEAIESVSGAGDVSNVHLFADHCWFDDFPLLVAEAPEEVVSLSVFAGFKESASRWRFALFFHVSYSLC